MFLDKGFEATSVNEVVRRAGGSLATLYRYFPTKEALFEGIIAELRAQFLAPLQDEAAWARPVEEVLLSLGRTHVALLGHPRQLALHRLLAAEGPRFPALRQALANEGVLKGQARLADYLAHKVNEGELQIDDIPAAVDQFGGMLRGNWHLMAVMGFPVVPEQQEAAVQGAVALFLGYYRVGASSR